MSKKSGIKLIAKNVFKAKTAELQTKEFNSCYERYINFRENKV